MATANVNLEFVENNNIASDCEGESACSSSEVNPGDPIAAPAAAFSSLPGYVAPIIQLYDGRSTDEDDIINNMKHMQHQDAIPLKYMSHKPKTPQTIVHGFIREFEANGSILSHSIPVSIREIILDFYDGPIEFFVLLSCVISKTELYTWNDIWFKSRNRDSLEITVSCLISCFIDLYQETLLYRWDRKYLQQYIEEMTEFIENNVTIEGALQARELCNIVEDFVKHRFDYKLKDLSAMNETDFHDSTGSSILIEID